MFERYTEKARRVIFYARYDASQYGSPYIETEHLLLGLLREDFDTASFLLPKLLSKEQVREKIESRITRRERISTSVEVPLTKDSKRVLNIAAEEADRFGHRHVGTEHLLLGLLHVEEGMASEILREHQVDLVQLRERIRSLRLQASSAPAVAATWARSPVADKEVLGLNEFVDALREGNWSEVGEFFAKAAAFIDASGELYSGRDQIISARESLLAPFARRNARHHIETQIDRGAALWVGTVLWDGVHLPAHTLPQQVRMTLVFGNDAGERSIFLIQLSSVAEKRAGKIAAT
jgi:hypothetical protein